MLFDDIGSYPPPDSVKREQMQEFFKDFERNRAHLSQYIQDAMRQKISAGVEVPNYPQFQDMNQQFLKYINDPELTEQPFLVREDAAKIVELEVLERVAEEYKGNKGERLKVRVCVTGPIELCYKQFGSGMYVDILLNFAKSVNRFLKKAMKANNMNVVAVSIDEPSIGISPFNLGDDDLARALDAASQGLSADVQIHLHSPLQYKLVCPVDGIKIIGLEAAASPSYLQLIDKRDLETYDKFLRVGIARTDIFRMASEFSEKHKIDIWRNKEKFVDLINEFESPDTIALRLRKAVEIFGERIKYVGPDCGLGTWPSQGTARMLLENTAKGVGLFRGETK